MSSDIPAPACGASPDSIAQLFSGTVEAYAPRPGYPGEVSSFTGGSDRRVRLSVIGAGYLGLTHAVCMAELGHEVLVVDVDADRIAQAAGGTSPFFEPGLEPLLRKNLDAGRLRFTTCHGDAATFGDVHFLCVGTPQAPDGSADLSQVYAAADALAPYLIRPCVIAGKSTVPVGTGRALARRIAERAPAGAGAKLAWNPEFLREGSAVQDSLLPDRIVLGVTSQQSAEMLRRVYAQPAGEGVPVVMTDVETAELVKVSANAFLAVRLSLVNGLAEVCEATGADVVALVRALAGDGRIGGRFLAPGLGYGGGCLPKDIRAFAAAARQLGVESLAVMLAEVDAINLRCRSRTVDLARQVAGGSLDGCRAGVLGVAFKPGSDDVRDSASLDVCCRLAAEGARVTVHDPVATGSAARLRPDLRYAASALEAADGADVLLHLTEWPEYRLIGPETFGGVVARRNMIDARCVLDELRWRSAGWSFRALGRP
jgi:UDPglucose 6-dehydrogenase